MANNNSQRAQPATELITAMTGANTLIGTLTENPVIIIFDNQSTSSVVISIGLISWKTFTAGEVLTAAGVNQYLYNSPNMTYSTASAFTVGTANINQTIRMNNGVAGTVTFSTATAFAQGEVVNILRDSSLPLTIASSGVFLRGKGLSQTSYAVNVQFDMVTVQCVDTNEYRIIGNIS